jgi:hypothetical protein
MPARYARAVTSHAMCRCATALLASLLAACAGTDDATPMKVQTPQQAVAEFLPQVEAALAGLSIRREAFEIRANRCEGREGETRGDLYYIWIGLRGTAPGNDIARQIEAAHARWRDAGWEITRFRTLDNGGVNLAATDPATGSGYVLDSGFDPAPDAYVVGFFNTPCRQSPDGKVAFGTLSKQGG